jgi:hypothetical protein
MKRVYTVGLIVLALELWAYSVFREHPLVRPEWFGTLLLVIQLLMSLGGIYGARWLLRHSPIAKLEGPRRDWTRLWLWCGPIGGVLLVKACILGKLAADASGALFPGLVIAAHIAAGAVVWTVALPWAVSDLFADETTGFRERLLMQLGIAAHVIGFAVYIGFFPGRDVSPLTLVAAVFVFGFNLYYIMNVAIVWSFIFKFWEPVPLSPFEEELNQDLESPDDYIPEPEIPETTADDIITP